MYLPASFREDDPEVLHDLIRQRPLGTLISHGADGLTATPLPFRLAAEEGPHGVLRAHLARANPHWRALAAAAECLVIFQGDDGYITPNWYPSKAATGKAVPTWNYVAVHAWGRPQVIDDIDWLRAQLDQLTHGHEQRRAAPWSIDDAPADYIAAQIKAVVGLEIRIDRIEGKWKMSQNKDAADRAGVRDGLAAADDPHRHPALSEIIAP
jgi:transcriptional regulator